MGTLRHYEKQGLLQPEYLDEKTGYRYYSIRQFEVLNTICYLRVLDFPLSEITDFLNNRDLPVIEEKLIAQKQLIREKIAELTQIEKKIDRRLCQFSDARCSRLDEIEHAMIPESRIVRVCDRLHHLDVNGFSREITLIDEGVTRDPEKYATEISIPVKESAI